MRRGFATDGDHAGTCASPCGCQSGGGSGTCGGSKNAFAVRLSILQSAFDEVPEGIVISDLDDKCYWINPAFTRLFGYTNDDVRGKRLPFVPAEEMAAVAEEIGDLIDGKPPQEREARRMTRDGRIIEVLLTRSLCRDQQGRPSQILTTIRARSPQTAEDGLAGGSGVDGESTLSRGVAHEFNNILYIISACTEILECELPEEGNGHRYVKEITAATKRATALVRRIRQATFNEGGSMVIR